MKTWGSTSSLVAGGLGTATSAMGDQLLPAIAFASLGTLCACTFMIVDRLTACRYLEAVATLYAAGGDGVGVTEALLDHYPKSLRSTRTVSVTQRKKHKSRQKT